MTSQIHEDEAVSSLGDVFTESGSTTLTTYDPLFKGSALLRGHRSEVMDATFIPGTRLLVTCSTDKSIRVWDFDTEQQVGEPLLGHDHGVCAVAASSNGRWIVSGAKNGGIIVWEIGKKKTLPVSFKGHECSVWSIAFAPNGETFASASNDLTVCVWKRETGEIILGPLKVGNRALSVAYSPDGTKLAAGTDKHIIIWNIKTGKELLKIEQRAFRVAFTPDGRRLVSGNHKDIRISDATTGHIIKQFDAHTTENFSSLAIAPNGTKFATTSYDKTTRFFDLTTFEQMGEPLEHPDEVWGLAFSEDNQLIATGCADKLARTWTVPLSESELQQSTENILKKTITGQQTYPRRAPIQTIRFFDGFDPHSPPGRNSRNAITSRHAEGSGIKNTMNRLFSRTSAPHDHTPRRRSIPLVDVFATRGKHRTANPHTGKRDKKLQQQCPPRKQAHASASSSNTPPAGTSNVVGGATPATLQTGDANAFATTTHPSPLDVGHDSDTTCFEVLTGCFSCLSHTQQTSSAAPHTG